tara:strand:- start:618 stop:902 length:285 start_codon:yes stop_codon:yes gene_type:complete
MKNQATFNLYPNIVNLDEKYGCFDKAGKKVIIDDSQVQIEMRRLQAEYDSLAYSRARANAYPDFGSQLNKIYDDGLEKWKSEMIDPIKAKFPKP